VEVIQNSSVRRVSSGTRALMTVLFTDMVGSTELASRLEDRRWRALLTRHNALIRKELKRYAGREVDTAGDGFFAVFSEPAQAVRCAAAITQAVRELGIEVRAGLHVGECEVMGRKVSGIAVHIGARVLAEAAPNEVLVSGTLKELVSGSGLTFEDRGTRTFKGVAGDWRLFALQQEEGAPAAPIPMKLHLDEGERSPWWLRPPGLLVAATIAVIAAALVLTLRREDSVSTGPNTVAVIDPTSNSVGESIKVGTGPAGIAIGEGGAWVANFDDRTVSRLDVDTATEIGRTGGVGVPTAIAVGEGGIWVGDEFADTLSLIDPRTSQVVNSIDGAGGTGVAVGFGSVWVTDAKSDSVLRINPSTFDVERIRLERGSGPAAVAAGHDAVWVTNSLKKSVAKIDPDTGAIAAADIALCCAPSAIAAGPSGVWVTSIESDAVAKIDPDTDSSALSVEVGDAPTGIVATADAVWVAASRAGSVWRIDPRSGSLVSRISLGGSPRALAVARDGDVWVAVASRA